MAEEENLPPEVLEAYEQANVAMLPAKSRLLYERAYKKFMNWRKEKGINSFSEKVLMAYFKLQSDKCKPTTVMARASMVKSMLHHHQKIDTRKC